MLLRFVGVAAAAGVILASAGSPYWRHGTARAPLLAGRSDYDGAFKPPRTGTRLERHALATRSESAS